MRFASLGSGSRGNATLVEAGQTRLLVDCGYTLRELEHRLDDLGLSADALSAILVTHEHADHVRGVGALARRYGVPVWTSSGTARAAALGDLPSLQRFASHGGAFRIGEVEIEPFAVPHDAREPCQFVFAAEGRRLGLLTDAGRITPHIVASLRCVDALVLECNHDPDMLARGPYPPPLRARVGGPLGHLSNAQAADLLQRVDHVRLSHLVAGHLSEKNNHPELAAAALLAVSPDLAPRLSVLRQDSVSGWFPL
jgi:phosphoribosyl 1,2-cyclic phosphodiesterase